MSRIQEILARADRDGMTRRTQAEPDITPPPPALSGAVIAPVAGSSALDPAPFIGPPDTPSARAFSPAPAVPERLRPAADAPEPRTARATLHPALVAAIAPHSVVAERYRAIRTRLSLREDGGPLRSILVTSPGAADGKSITAANLALTMAQEFQRHVVLVDANLRAPSIHSLFGLHATPGLSDVLAGEATLDEALLYLPDHHLTILPAGRTPQFPTELLGSAEMRRTTDLLRARFDRLLVDVPAVTPLADVGTIAPLADGVVLVVRAGITQRPDLDQALTAFDEEKVLGVVLNDVK